MGRIANTPTRPRAVRRPRSPGGAVAHTSRLHQSVSMVNPDRAAGDSPLCHFLNVSGHNFEQRIDHVDNWVSIASGSNFAPCAGILGRRCASDGDRARAQPPALRHSDQWSRGVAGFRALGVRVSTHPAVETAGLRPGYGQARPLRRRDRASGEPCAQLSLPRKTRRDRPADPRCSRTEAHRGSGMARCNSMEIRATRCAQRPAHCSISSTRNRSARPASPPWNSRRRHARSWSRPTRIFP